MCKEWMSLSRTWPTKRRPVSRRMIFIFTPVLVSELVDQIYKKERQYTKNYDKDNILNGRSPIFDLQKFHNLKSHTGVETSFAPKQAVRHEISMVPSQLSLITGLKRPLPQLMDTFPLAMTELSQLENGDDSPQIRLVQA